ncbi:MAG: hypothetical protein OEU32_07295 [Acidimicrobiia bacterium]|nr:hypothetical protein [Acidimicrobiia bacterium]
MLSSIHPLGERGRHNRFGVTAGAHVVGSAVGGALVGLTAGSIGSLVSLALDPAEERLAVIAVAAVLLATALDGTGVSVPSTRRQVDERWLGRYRGTVYGAGYGFQLGAGIATVVTTWSVPLWIVLAGVTTSPAAGGVIGACFGLARGAAILLVGNVRTPERLRSFHRSLADRGSVVRVGSLVTQAGVGLAAIALLAA